MKIKRYDRIEQVDIQITMDEVYALVEAKYKALHPQSGDYNISIEYDPYSGCCCTPRIDGVNVRFKIGHMNRS